MNPGPSPTMLADWISLGAYWWLVLGCIAVACLAILTVNFVRVLQEEAEDEEPTVRDVCDLESCNEPSTVEFDGPLYICAKHAGPVSAWAPVISVQAPYDQNEESA